MIHIECSDSENDDLQNVSLLQYVEAGSGLNGNNFYFDELYFNEIVGLEILMDIDELTTSEEINGPIVETLENYQISDQVFDELFEVSINNSLEVAAVNTQRYINYLERRQINYTIQGHSILRDFPYGGDPVTATNYVDVQTHSVSYTYNSNDLIGQILITSSTSFKKLSPYNSTGQVIGVYSSISRDYFND